MKLSAKVSSHPVTSPGKGVGRGNNAMDSHHEAPGAKPLGIVFGRREVPGVHDARVDPSFGERTIERGDDRGDAFVATALGDEAPSRTKRVPNPADHVVGALHPMESRVAEDGVEFTIERLSLCSVHHARIEAEPAVLRFDLCGAAVDGYDPTSRGRRASW